jgi:hypothetical protein
VFDLVDLDEEILLGNIALKSKARSDFRIKVQSAKFNDSDLIEFHVADVIPKLLTNKAFDGDIGFHTIFPQRLCSIAVIDLALLIEAKNPEFHLAVGAHFSGSLADDKFIRPILRV